MHDIELLEKQWKRYQIKKYFPLIIGGMLLIVIVTIFRPQDKAKDSNLSKENIPLFVHGAMNIIEPTISEQHIRIAMVDKEKEFNISTTKEEIKNTIDVNQSTNIVANNDLKANLLQKNTPIITDEYSNEKIKINFEQTLDINSLTDVMRRFYESKDPDDALFLAINYYERYDYNKAFYWALETNKITEDLEESWIIMAKSKAKMGDRNEALRILRAYAAKKDSKAALGLIEQIETNQW